MTVIYPAIDMRNGKCVRLQQGDYAKETVYHDSPFEMASHFSDQGAEWIHMVDLDGAKDGKRVNQSFVFHAAEKLKSKVQIGGGIRTEADIVDYLDRGVSRVILGSMAVQQKQWAVEMIRKYKEAIAIGLDARGGFVATHGWIETSSVQAIELGKYFADAGADTFIYTDIATDGMLTGPNIQACVDLAKATKKDVIVSGGVSELSDLRAVHTNSLAGVIIGKALYEGRFSVIEALKEVSGC